MLLSYVNTQLRDNYEDPADLAAAEGIPEEDLVTRLADAGYVYDEKVHQFRKK
jgi:hypothetical protein